MQEIIDFSDSRGKILEKFLNRLGFNSIQDFQNANGLLCDGIFGLKSYNKLYHLLLKVNEVTYFEGSYYKQPFPKKQIVWHHSAGSDNAQAIFKDWQTDKRWHVATAIAIQDDGSIARGYDEGEGWAVHIGAHDIRLPNYRELETQSIGVEICNWGYLSEKNGKFLAWAGYEIPKEKVIELNYKGFKYFEKYTDKEIETLKIWTLLNAMRFDISLKYNEADMWGVSARACAGANGIFTHNSFVSWKSDVSPQPKLIEMAQSL